MKKNYSPFGLYAYISAVLIIVVFLTMLLVRVNTPWFLILLLVTLLGLGSLIPITSRLELINRVLGNLCSGLPFPAIRQRWPDPLYPLLLQVQELSSLDQDVATLREGWLSQVAQGAVQEERNRLARELHDSIKQQLFSIQMSAAAIEQRWESDPLGAQTTLADLRQSAQEALTEMNVLLLQLSPAPLERVGLTQAIQEQCDALGFRSGAQVICQISELPSDERLPAGWQEGIFRIVQEALSNIARHARATHVNLSLQQDSVSQLLTLKIEDDGQGYSPSAKQPGQGLRGILQRTEAMGGQASFKTQPGQGVVLQVNLPFLTVVMEEEIDIPVDTRPNKITWIALLGGLLTAAATTPIILAQTGIYLGASVSSAVWLWLILAAALLTATGWLTAHFIPAQNRSIKILLSATSGAIAAMIAFAMIIAASAAIQGMDALLNHGLNPASEAQSTILIIDAALGIFSWTHVTFWLLILTGTGLGAIGGQIAGTSNIKTDLAFEFPLRTFLALIIAGSSCAYLFGTLVLPIMEAAMLESALKIDVLYDLRFLPQWLPIIILTTPLLILFISLAIYYRKLSVDFKSGTTQKLEQVHWSSFNLAILCFGIAATSSLLGWIAIMEIPTTSTVLILGVALLLLTNAILFLRLTILSRRHLTDRLQPRWLWLVYAIPALVVLLPGFILGSLYDVFTAWVLVFYLALVLGFVLAFSLLPQSARPAAQFSIIKKQAAQFNNNWLAAALSLIAPVLPMGSAGLAIISVVIPFVQPLDSERLFGWSNVGDTIASLLRDDLLVRQPLGFVLLLAIALVLNGLWGFLTHLRILNRQRRL
jgi:signal transduction histidine kinase